MLCCGRGSYEQLGRSSLGGGGSCSAGELHLTAQVVTHHSQNDAVRVDIRTAVKQGLDQRRRARSHTRGVAMSGCVSGRRISGRWNGGGIA